ncbi:MAG: ABC transporter permease [Bacteroidales bacterium]|nr:ABC transporter permease [Bacteroidales bacterium]MCF8389656.1 ABC transporter permease [Bacteroidales bacterium]
MKNYIMAWRNLWRNKRRTLITVASIFFGVLMSTVMSSMQEGSYANMIDNVVKFYSGYIQIHEEEYWENKTLYYSFDANDSLYTTLESTEGIVSYTPRLESFALASSEEKTQAVLVMGVDPEKENALTNLKSRLVEGEYFDGNNTILLASKLAENLGLELNDSVALLSQGYFGNTAAELFVVRGILNFPNPELNKSYAYLDLKSAQHYYSCEGKLTSLNIMVEDYSRVQPVLKELKSKLGSPYASMSWDEMQPELVQMVESDRAGGVIMKAILFMIIGFGILGTIMMMMSERRKELGLMVAVGMQKYKLASILFFETIYMGLIGVVSGLLASIPIIIYFLHNPAPITGDAGEVMISMGIEPLLMFSAAPEVFLNQVVLVFIITLFISIYPLINVSKLNVIKYLRD